MQLLILINAQKRFESSKLLLPRFPPPSKKIPPGKFLIPPVSKLYFSERTSEVLTKTNIRTRGRANENICCQV